MPGRDKIIQSLRSFFPVKIYDVIVRLRYYIVFFLHIPTKIQLLMKRATPAISDKTAVSYAFIAPGAGTIARGGRVKLSYLSKVFPENGYCSNILYLVSSALPPHFETWIYKFKKKGAKIVLNQNGVIYEGCYGPGWEVLNRPLKKALYAADYVIYQSKFCKMSADLFLGKVTAPTDIVYNAVDTSFFTPSRNRSDSSRLVILLGGNQYELYRLEIALRTVAIIKKKISDVKLLITGKLCWTGDAGEAKRILDNLIRQLKIKENVELIGTYLQNEAPDIFRRAHILIHPKYNDPCPTVVIEAMACGLPVVYSCSGGVPELVGSDAGIGIDAELNWERKVIPDPELLSQAILKVNEKRKTFSEAARERAEKLFDINIWIEKHRTVFQKMLS